jgi:hypothetical protein
MLQREGNPYVDEAAVPGQVRTFSRRVSVCTAAGACSSGSVESSWVKGGECQSTQLHLLWQGICAAERWGKSGRNLYRLAGSPSMQGKD